MADDGFGSDLWKSVQDVKLGQDGGIEAPVRANGRDGIVVGRRHVAAAETADSSEAPTRSWWRRLLRR